MKSSFPWNRYNVILHSSGYLFQSFLLIFSPDISFSELIVSKLSIFSTDNDHQSDWFGVVLERKVYLRIGKFLFMIQNKIFLTLKSYKHSWIFNFNSILRQFNGLYLMFCIWLFTFELTEHAVSSTSNTFFLSSHDLSSAHLVNLSRPYSLYICEATLSLLFLQYISHFLIVPSVSLFHWYLEMKQLNKGIRYASVQIVWVTEWRRNIQLDLWLILDKPRHFWFKHSYILSHTLEQ